MDGHFINFIVYTLSMLGVLFLAVIVAKKSMFPNNASKNINSFLDIESFMSLEPRKNIYVIRAGEERFLISTDAETTRFMTKLDSGNVELCNVQKNLVNSKNLQNTNKKNNSYSSMQKLLSGIEGMGRK